MLASGRDGRREHGGAVKPASQSTSRTKPSAVAQALRDAVLHAHSCPLKQPHVTARETLRRVRKVEVGRSLGSTDCPAAVLTYP